MSASRCGACGRDRRETLSRRLERTALSESVQKHTNATTNTRANTAQSEICRRCADDGWSPHTLETEQDHRDLGRKRSQRGGEGNGSVCLLKHTRAECEWLTIVGESPLKRIRLGSERTFKTTVFSHHCLDCLVSSPVHQISGICHGHVSLSLYFGMPAIITTVTFSSDIWLPLFFLPVFESFLLWCV